MIRRIIFKPEAEVDLAEAHDWYEERDFGLGAEFIRAVTACLEQIQRQPEIYPVTHKNVRQGVMRRFPYSVFYFVSGETLYVAAVFHSSRDPRIWKARVQR